MSEINRCPICNSFDLHDDGIFVSCLRRKPEVCEFNCPKRHWNMIQKKMSDKEAKKFEKDTRKEFDTWKTVTEYEHSLEVMWYVIRAKLTGDKGG